MKMVNKTPMTILVVLGLSSFVYLESTNKKLGSHSPPSHGATVLAGKFPPPGVMYYHFVQPGKPLLMKNVLEESGYPAFKKWTDEYLSSQYGNEIVDIEKGKKEDRAGDRLELTMSQFIKVYNNSDLYMVNTVPEPMQDEVLVPYSLSCGGFQHNIQEAVMWFSSGGTSSVLHYDLVDNINCLLDGKKQLVLINKEHSGLVEEAGWVDEGSYSQVDLDDIDPDLYPGILSAPWYQINMQKGDCVYIPYKWYHHVYSPPGRNVAVNLWFSHLWWYNQTDCKNVDKENKPLSEYDIASPNEQLRSEFLSNFADMTDISQERFIQDCGCKDEKDAIKMWDLLNWKKDNHLTWEEFYSFRMEDIVQRFPHCFHDLPNEEVADEFMRDESAESDNMEGFKDLRVERDNFKANLGAQSDENVDTQSSVNTGTQSTVNVETQSEEDIKESEISDDNEDKTENGDGELISETNSVRLDEIKTDTGTTVKVVVDPKENKKSKDDLKHEEL